MAAEMNERPIRLAGVTALPVQYDAPFFRELAKRPEVDLTVLYGTLLGVDDAYDPEMGINFSWDIPLLDGYDYEVVGTIREPEQADGWELFSTAVFRELSPARFDAALIYGWGSWYNRCAIAACMAKRIPFFLTGDATPIYAEPPLRGALKHLFVGEVVKRAAGCLYLGTLQRIYFERLGVPAEKLFFHPYVVENERFFAAADQGDEKKREIRAELGLPNETPLVAFVGKLIPRKRPGDLLTAISMLQKKGVECGVVFIGEGELRKQLEERVDREKIKNVCFTGFFNQTRIPEVVAACDVFALPSAHDPRGTATNEAMAAGLPAVISHQVGIWGFGDIVEPGTTGMVHYTGDVDSLAYECLEPLLTDEKLRRKMGEAARIRMETWGLTERVEGVIEALNSLK